MSENFTASIRRRHKAVNSLFVGISRQNANRPAFSPSDLLTTANGGHFSVRT